MHKLIQKVFTLLHNPRIEKTLNVRAVRFRAMANRAKCRKTLHEARMDLVGITRTRSTVVSASASIAIAFTLLAPVQPSASAHAMADARIGLSSVQVEQMGEQACASPPVGFDALHASAATLLYYGLPHRPPNASAQPHWLDVVRHAKQRVCGSSVTGPNYAPSTKPDNNIPGREQSGRNIAGYGIWAGYVATDGGFDYTFSDWTVPCWTSSSPYNATAVQWVGIGGYGTTNLWQAGTETDRPEGYRFWYEAFPIQAQQYVNNFPVACGDHVAVEVDYGITVTNQSSMWMSNNTRNTYTNKTVNFQPNTNSAEWIDERTQKSSGCPYELADFQHTDWSYSQAESTRYNNILYPISSYNYDIVDMYNNPASDYTLLAATPFGLNSDGKSFTDQWYNFGTQPC